LWNKSITKKRKFNIYETIIKSVREKVRNEEIKQWMRIRGSITDNIGRK